MSTEGLTDLGGLSPDELDALDRLLPGAGGQVEISRRTERDVAPLSLAQRRLWIVDQLRPGDPAYHLTLAFRLRGELDVDALQFSITELVRRHEALRTTIVAVDGVPYQRIAPHGPVAFPVVDLKGAAPHDREAQAAAAARIDVDTPFVLETGPLFRARLVHLDVHEHLLILTMHHIVSDGWSMGILMDDIRELYASRVEHRPCALLEPRLQYADFAGWQQEHQRPPAMSRHVDYWRRELTDAPELQLPCDRPRERTPSTRGGSSAITIDAELLHRLEGIARTGRATRYMALLAAYVLLLSRYARSRDVVVGTSTAGRDRADVESIVGFFVNVLPMRIRIPHRVSFRTLLGEVRDQSLAAHEHQSVSFEAIVDAVAPDRTFDRHPICQVAFSAQDMLRADLTLPGLRAEPFRIDSTTTRFDLEVYVVDDGGGLQVHAVYNSHLFDPATVHRMLAHYGRLLQCVADDPDADLDTIELLTPAEHAEVVSSWNATSIETGTAATILDLFDHHVDARPGSTAVVFGEHSWSYAELDARAADMARRLRRQGVRRGALVGLCVDRSPEMVAALLAIMKAGAAYVPLDPAHPPDRLMEIVRDARLEAIVVETSLRAVFASFSGPLVDPRLEVAPAGDEEADAAPPDHALTGSDLAYVIYTSGSTGRPKGTLLEHRGLVNVVSEQMRMFGIGPVDRVLQFASLSFDASVFEIVMALGTGAALVIGRRDELIPGPILADFMDRHAISATVLPPSVLALVPPGDLPCLRALTVAGEACPQELINQWGAGRRFWNLYGPTETTIWATASEPLAPGDAPVIGRPIGNARIYVLDDCLNPVPVGVTGEMYIGGCGVARGYLNRPALTAERFVPDPYSTEAGARLYRTGDLVRYRPGGVLEFVGRRDHQVKLHGHRIELGEIEAALSEIPGVETAVVKLWENDGTRRIVAYVLTTSGPAPSANQLRETLRKRLPPYMIPGLFVSLDKLPLTTSGKLNRAALPEPSTAPADAPVTDGAPRNAIEDTLARVWASVLGLSRVGIHDNFFDVGGDSILSIQIASRARVAGVPLSPQHFFEHQTVADQAAQLAAAGLQSGSRETVTGLVPLTPIQQWLFEQNLARPGEFSQAVLLELSAAWDVETVRTALNALIEHHDVLRSRFIRTESGWAQEILPPGGSIEVPMTDFSGMADAERAVRMAETCRHVHSTVDIESGRLIVAAYFDMSPSLPPRLFVAVHHLVIDGVSWRILLEDLESAVSDVLASRAVALPPKTASFRQWAAHLNALPGSAWFAGQQAHWVSVCRRAGSRLPGDVIERDRMTYGAAATVTARFTREETNALLRDVPRRADARVHEVLFGALAYTLAEHGVQSVSIDVESHGREPDASWNLDVSRTAGWFTSVYPVGVDVTPGMGAEEILAASRAALRSVPAAGIGYGLVRYLSGDPHVRSLLDSAQSDIVFNYLGQLDSTPTVSRTLRVAADCDLPVAEANQRPYPIEVNARVTDGDLQVDWTFDPRMHAPVMMERLVDRFAACVRTLIGGVSAAAPPIDSGLAALDHDTLRMLLDRYRDEGVEDVYPLTALQHGMVLHSMATPASGVFVTQIGLVLGDVDAAALREAWRRLHREHAIFRTVFADVGGGEFRQIVLTRPSLSWIEHDWSELAASDTAQRIEAVLVAERQAGFDLSACPPSRVVLIRTAPHAWQLIWSHHHALLDGWSGAMVLDELFATYRALTRGLSPEIPERPRFREHVAWLRGRDRQTGRDFWQLQLAGLTSPTRLSVDGAPGARVHSATQIHDQERRLSADLTRSLGEFASRRRLTLSTVIHGAWALLLSRYSGEQQVVFGTAVAGRPPLPGVERSIGLFMNGLPVAVTVDAQAAVSSWLDEVQKRLVQIRQHEHDALWEIQEWTGTAGQPLFETTLAFESYPVAPSYVAGARDVGLVDFKYVSHTSAALHLRVLPGEQIRLMLSHDQERFSDETAAVMLEQLESALRQFVDTPDAPLRDVSLRVGAEPGFELQLPVTWSGAAHEKFSAQADHAPARTAILEIGAAVTYGELQQRSDSTAAALRASGIHHEDLVGVFAPRGSLLVVGMLGTLKAGAAFTVLDPAYPPQQIVTRMDLADVKAVLYAGEREEVPTYLRDWLRERDAHLISLEGNHLVEQPAPIAAAEVSPGSLAYVAFTSGSTGEPKAVLGRHAALSHYADWLRETFDVGVDDRFSMLSALSHDPLLRDIFAPLQLGAALCVPTDEIAGTPGALAAWAATLGVTRMNVTPSMAQVLIEGAPDGCLPLVKQMFFVGEPLTRSLVRRVQRVARSAVCVNLYGTTETQQGLGFHVVDPDMPGGRDGVLPAGRGMPGVQLIVARDDRQPVGVGEPGQIWVRSPLLARGYRGISDATTSRFVNDAFGPGTGPAYRTGDLGRYLPSGDVVVLGRDDDQIKIRGFRVEPVEIESVILRNPNVGAVAVVATSASGMDPALVAYVTGDVDVAELRNLAAARLPSHMVPQRFVRVSALPRTGSGKVDRRFLAQVDLHDQPSAGDLAPPQTSTEVGLAEIWRTLLPVNDVGRDGSFFELGGHSVAAARLTARIRDRFHVDLRLSDVFARPRLHELAAFVDERVASAEDAVVGELLDEIRALSPEELQAILADVAGSAGETV